LKYEISLDFSGKIDAAYEISSHSLSSCKNRIAGQGKPKKQYKHSPTYTAPVSSVFRDYSPHLPMVSFKKKKLFGDVNNRGSTPRLFSFIARYLVLLTSNTFLSFRQTF